MLGRLVERGLHDELKGSAYAIVEGIDGRTHHIRFTDIEMTGDAAPGAIVEARSYDDAQGAKRLSLATRSDLSIEAQVTAPGSTWIDRQLLGGIWPWRAVVSDPNCAKPWTVGSTISQAKVLRAGRQGSSLPAIFSIR